jgi:hypothetical protein
MEHVMKKLSFITLLLITACQSGPPPVWQQELNNLGRQWSDPVPIEQPNDYKSPRDQYADPLKRVDAVDPDNPDTGGVCRFL